MSSTKKKQNFWAGPGLLIIPSIILGATNWSSNSSVRAADPVCTAPKPIPAEPTIMPAFDAANTDRNALVSGSLGNPLIRRARFTQGETVYTLVHNPNNNGDPCPTPSWSPSFQGLNAPQAKNVLVTMWGTPDAFASLQVAVATNDQGAFGNAIALQSTVPGGLPPGVSAPSIPAGMSSGYFVLTIPAGSSSTASFTYRAKESGRIYYRMTGQVVGRNSTRVFSESNDTRFLPRLTFSTASRSAPADQCSDPVTIQTVNGDGVQRSVVRDSNFNVSLIISASPNDIYQDSSCVYPESAFGIRNPVPAPPAGLKPPTVTHTNQLSFHYKGKQAQAFDVSVIYMDGNTQRLQVTQVNRITPRPPVAMIIDKNEAPSSVNQGACSAAIRVKFIDNFGNQAALQANRTIMLNGRASTRFYQNADCSATLGNSVPLNTGASEFTFHVKDGTPGAMDLTLASSDWVARQHKLHVLSMGTGVAVSDRPSATRLAIRIWDRLVGLPASLTDPKINEMTELLLQGRALEAANIATNQDGFFNITIKNMATPLSNRLKDALAPLNDFVTTWIGTVRDDRDARSLLTGNFIYVGQALKTASVDQCADSTVYRFNDHFQTLQNNFTNLRTNLVPVRQCAYNNQDFGSNTPVALADTAGLLTTRTWGKEHMFAGTNRRAVEFAFDVFLCKGIGDISDREMPDWHIRRDVDRAPGGDPKVYTASCRACHGGLDGLAGAFSFFDAYEDMRQGGNRNDFRLFYVNKGGYGADAVMPKFNQNDSIFPPGWVTGDDDWINFFTENRNQALGWDPNVPSRGKGVKSLGEMLGNSYAFAQCMSKRVFKEICKREAGTSESQIINDLAQDFKASTYNMRRLFARTATLATCVGSGE